MVIRSQTWGSNPRLKYSIRKGFIRFEKQRWNAIFSDSILKIRIRFLARRIRFEIPTLFSKNKYREESLRILKNRFSPGSRLSNRRKRERIGLQLQAFDPIVEDRISEIWMRKNRRWSRRPIDITTVLSSAFNPSGVMLNRFFGRPRAMAACQCVNIDDVHVVIKGAVRL
jgi:hypothetical protein